MTLNFSLKTIFRPLLLLLLPFAATIAQTNIELVSHIEYPEGLSNIWGYVAPDGTEYALVGTVNGTAIVSLADPANPVEVAYIEDASSIWHEIKVFGHYAYTANETGGGITIMDLSGLPDNVVTTFWTGQDDPLLPEPLNTCHTLFVDEKGFGYFFGTNIGTVIVDLNQDPANPVVKGIYDVRYVHDGFVRGDTLWAAEVYDGTVSVINLTDRSNPQVMSLWTTPNNFAHNVWLTPDNKTAFTTDEVSGAFVTSYDVSDIYDVKELDRVQMQPGTGVIPHNTYWHNGFLPTSYYRNGVAIFDAMVPTALVEVGNYDTAPNYPSSDGFNGCWGVYPYLPSGLILASDMEAGFYVLNPHYVHASFIGGTITDAQTGLPISGVNISVEGSSNTDTQSSFGGDYTAGVPDAGNYTVTYNLLGYQPITITVNLQSGIILDQDISLQPISTFALAGGVTNAENGQPIANAMVQFINGDLSFTANTDNSGNFTLNNFIPADYDIVVGKWGFVTQGFSAQTISETSGPLQIALQPGYYDDFALDFDWIVTGSVASGEWERGVPFETLFNGLPLAPGQDIPDDVGNQCFVTQIGEGLPSNAGDVDNGTTILTSPPFDLSGYTNPHVTCYYWFKNAGGNSAPNDQLIIQINNGSQTQTVRTITATTPLSGQWVPIDIRVADFISMSNTMRISFQTGDQESTGHLVEAGVDKFTVYDSLAVGIAPPIAINDDIAVSVLPNPFDEQVRFVIQADHNNNAGATQSPYRLTLTCLDGRMLGQTLFVGNSLTLLRHNLPQGILLYTIEQNGKIRAKGKIVAQ